MKILIRDWTSLDAKTFVGAISCIIIFLILINFIKLSSQIKIEYVILTLITLFMTFQSVRHLIYLVPFGILVVLNSELRFDFKFDLNVLSYFLTLLIVLIVIASFTSLDYNNFIGDELNSRQELVSILQETNKDDDSYGLFTGVDLNYWGYGIKPFKNGAYPMNPMRQYTVDFIQSYACVADIKNAIEYWDLSKFLIPKEFQIYNGSVTITNSLYDYLSHSDEYKVLYEDDVIAYFVER